MAGGTFPIQIEDYVVISLQNLRKMINRHHKILLVIFIVALTISLFIINREYVPVRPNTIQYNKTSYNNRTTDNNSNDNYTIFVLKNICEGCHMSSKVFVPQAISIKQHINGGAYCLVCHNFSHNIHPIDKDVTCEKCHEGKNPIRPIFINGNISCNNCHDYPNPLKPSYGNIITVHRPRDVTCNTCHTNKCTKCHIEIGTSEKWEKRLNHFRVILNTQRYGNDAQDLNNNMEKR